MKQFSFLNDIPVAHRGLHEDGIPENSLSAFRRARDLGFAIETDVRLTKDGAVVAFHDDSLFRACGIDKKVNDCTLAQLKKCNLFQTEERIPTLSELLSLVDGRVPLLIEIKQMKGTPKKHFLEKVASELRDYQGEFAIQSFDPLYVRTFKKLRPDIPCGVLAAANSNRKDLGCFPRIKAEILKNMRLNFYVKPDFISYCGADLPQKAYTKFSGIRLAWTIRSKDEELHARKNGADNIIFENYRPE